MALTGGGSLKWRGVSTNAIYEFATSYVPVALLDVYGNPITQSIATYNGEQVIFANNDNSVARGTARSAPAGASVTALPDGGDDIFHCYVQSSPAEEAIKP